MKKWRVVGALGVGYVGVYLCRKNLAVAIPLMQSSLHATRGELGRVASAGTIAYAAGKLTLGLFTDRVGGRRGFLLALAAVALFGALSGLSPTLSILMLLYALNRFFGAGGWQAMVKLVPTWFPPERVAGVVGALSLSYVLGGIAATLFARQVVAHGGGWRAVLSAPAALLTVIAIACFFLVRAGPREDAAHRDQRPHLGQVLALLRRPQFIVVCVLSFVITLLRESFNVWSVDFLMSISHESSVEAAAAQSTIFDLAGAVAIVAMGMVYERTPGPLRRWLVATVLAALSVVLWILPSASPSTAAILIGAVGFGVYGPYSLLAGVMAIECGGPRLAGSASGIVEAVGYCAGILSGEVLGRIVDAGGYRLGFQCLAVLAALSAVCASRLGRGS